MVASKSPTLRPGATLADRYEIVSHSRSGVLSEVFLAKVLGAAELAELTVLRTAFASAELPRQVEQELRKVAGLGLSAIPSLKSVFSDPAGLIVVVEAPPESAQARTLRARLDTDGAFDAVEVSRVVTEVASVLDAMHRSLSPLHLHRRLNPETVRTLASGEVQVLECGLAHALVATGVVTPRIPMQSRQYLSPDELLQRPSVRADLFALTSLAFECLTATVAFQGPTEASLSAAILRGPRPSVCALRDDLASEVDTVLARGWAAEPSKVFASATELAEALHEVLSRQSSPGSWPVQSPTAITKVQPGAVTLKPGGSVPPPLTDTERAALEAVPLQRTPKVLNPTQRVIVPRIHAPGTEKVQDDDAVVDAAMRNVAPRPDPTDPPPPMLQGNPTVSRPPTDGWIDLHEQNNPRPARALGSPSTESPSNAKAPGRQRFGTIVSSVPPPPAPAQARHHEDSSPSFALAVSTSPSGSTPPPSRPSSTPPPLPATRSGMAPPPLPSSRPSSPVVPRASAPPDTSDISFNLDADVDELPPSALHVSPVIPAAPPVGVELPTPVSASVPPPADHPFESFELSPSVEGSEPAPAVTPSPYPAPAVTPSPYPAPAVTPSPYPAPAVTPSPYPAPAAIGAPVAPVVPTWEPIAAPPPAPTRRPIGKQIAIVGAVAVVSALVAALGMNFDRLGSLLRSKGQSSATVASHTPSPQGGVDAGFASAPTTVPVVAARNDGGVARAELPDVAVVLANADVSEIAAPPDAGSVVARTGAADAAVSDSDAGAANTAVVADAGDEEDLRRHPRHRDVRALEELLRPEVLTCVGGEHRRRVRVKVTYAGATGAVTAVNISGIYAEPPIGPCIEAAVRRHILPRFSDESYEARMTFRRRSHSEDEEE